jgi:hypothetical protein
MASIRFVDVDPDEDLENESPVHGVQYAEDMTLEEACKVAKAACGQLATWDLELALAAAARAVKRLEKNCELAPLLRDEARAVHVYTQESLFYKELNKRLRLRERESLKPFFPYLKQFLNGLHRLAPEDDTVYRGVRLDLSAKYCQGNDLVWWAFSSATSTAAVLNNDTFLGQVGDRTLFSIKVHRCVNIRRYALESVSTSAGTAPLEKRANIRSLMLNISIKVHACQHPPTAVSTSAVSTSAGTAPLEKRANIRSLMLNIRVEHQGACVSASAHHCVNIRCVNIRRYSAIGNEDERLILPGTAFHVKSHLALGGGLTMIQLEEDRECPPLISGFAFSPTQHSTAKEAKVSSSSYDIHASSSFSPPQHLTAKDAQERADAELAKKLQMQLQMQVSSSSCDLHASSSSYADAELAKKLQMQVSW